MTEKVERRLAAILSTDVVGYTRLMRADEEGTLARFRRHHDELIAPKIEEYQGRIVKLMGDGLLVEFSRAASTSRRNTCVKFLCRRFKPQRFAWSFVQLPGHPIQIRL